MRGHIIKRGKKYAIVVDIGRDNNNKRRQKWFSGYDRRCDAEDDLPNVLQKVKRGYKDPADMKLEKYFKLWLEGKKKAIAPGTYEHYESYIRKHVIPGLGNIKIPKFDSDHIEYFMEEVEEKDLSQRTKRHIYAILSNALSDGKKYGIDKDIMEDIDPPRVDKKEIEYWTQEEAHQFLDSLKSKNHAIPIIIALATGMRRGEVLGLRWSKINFENKTISVTHQLKKDDNGDWVLSPILKTKTSYRTIDIDDDTIEILESHKNEQKKNKMKSGENYGNLDLVCATTIGGFIKPTYLRTVLLTTIKKSGIKKIGFHGLRHTHATLLLSSGVHPKIVQERLGHRSIQTTLDTYSHVIPGIQKIAATSIQSSLYKKKEIKPENVISITKNKE